MNILVGEADTLLDTLLDDGTSDRTHQVLLWVYILPIFVLYVYNYARILNLYRAIVGTSFFTDIPLNKGGTIRPGEEPIVTVQICTFNEGGVVSETIDSACMLDWPKDKLYIDICDDSNDPHSLDVIKHAVMRWSLKGINITHRTREKRHGYKAGCLADHFHTLKGDFVAHFDADHRMEADFLKRTMPHFFDKLGCHNEDVGCVQAPWGYYNIHQNILTQADTLAMDIHHAIEQTGHSEALKVFSFNGTGGVWRKSAISAGGGWIPATVTEDLALSYNSFINGYKFVYVRDIPQLMESPACMQAHVQQKHRWTKGFLQVFRMETMNILRCKHASWWVKFEAFIHTTAPIQYTCLAILTIFYPSILAWHHIDSDLVRLLSVLPHTGPIAEAIVTIYAKAKGSDAEYGSFWSRTSRLAYIPHHIALKSGMMLFETMALMDGLTSNDATFLATPKEGAVTNPGKSASKKKSANGVHKKSANEYIAFFGLFLASYRLCFVYFVDLQHEIKSYAHVWFHLMNMCVVTESFTPRIQHLYQFHHDSPLSQEGFGFMLSGLLVVQTIFVMDHQMEVVQNGLSLGNHGLHASLVKSSWSCPVPSEELSVLKKLTPLVIFAQPKTGSNLLIDMLNKLNNVARTEDLEIVSLFELFSDDEDTEVQRGISATANVMGPTCLPNRVAQNWRSELVDKFQHRTTDPQGLLDYLEKVPSKSERPFYAFSVFSRHLKEMSLPVDEFVQGTKSMGGDNQAKYVILWRRRMIESYVSFVIAKESGGQGMASKTGDATVRVDRAELEAYIEINRMWYSSVRMALEAAGVQYEVLEYDTHMRGNFQQFKTLKKLFHGIGIMDAQVDPEKALDIIGMAKQSTTPIESRITNWDEVVEWGYSGSTEEWPDLFSNSFDIQ